MRARTLYLNKGYGVADLTAELANSELSSISETASAPTGPASGSVTCWAQPAV